MLIGAIGLTEGTPMQLPDRKGEDSSGLLNERHPRVFQTITLSFLIAF